MHRLLKEPKGVQKALVVMGNNVNKRLPRNLKNPRVEEHGANTRRHKVLFCCCCWSKHNTTPHIAAALSFGLVASHGTSEQFVCPKIVADRNALPDSLLVIRDSMQSKSICKWTETISLRWLWFQSRKKKGRWTQQGEIHIRNDLTSYLLVPSILITSISEYLFYNLSSDIMPPIKCSLAFLAECCLGGSLDLDSCTHIPVA